MEGPTQESGTLNFRFFRADALLMLYLLSVDSLIMRCTTMMPATSHASTVNISAFHQGFSILMTALLFNASANLDLCLPRSGFDIFFIELAHSDDTVTTASRAEAYIRSIARARMDYGLRLEPGARR